MCIVNVETLGLYYTLANLLLGTPLSISSDSAMPDNQITQSAQDLALDMKSQQSAFSADS